MPMFYRGAVHPDITESNFSFLELRHLRAMRIFLFLMVYHSLSYLHDDKRRPPLLLNLVRRNYPKFRFHLFLLLVKVWFVKRILSGLQIIRSFSCYSLLLSLDIILLSLSFIIVELVLALSDFILEFPMLIRVHFCLHWSIQGNFHVRIKITRLISGSHTIRDNSVTIIKEHQFLFYIWWKISFLLKFRCCHNRVNLLLLFCLDVLLKLSHLKILIIFIQVNFNKN